MKGRKWHLLAYAGGLILTMTGHRADLPYKAGKFVATDIHESVSRLHHLLVDATYRSILHCSAKRHWGWRATPSAVRTFWVERQ
ncbi:MAG: hypothetical protein DLM70_13200 [Chloroflexi bacterium]|nr:MAG: hypothetical protein DLM70_13200 [Chloroflexota bacterium]